MSMLFASAQRPRTVITNTGEVAQSDTPPRKI